MFLGSNHVLHWLHMRVDTLVSQSSRPWSKIGTRIADLKVFGPALSWLHLDQERCANALRRFSEWMHEFGSLRFV